MNKIRTCKHCNKNFDISDKPSGWMANHTRWCDLNPKRDEYKIKSSNAVVAMNKARLENPNNLNQYTKAKSQGIDLKCSDETKLKISKAKLGKSHTEKTKQLLSEKQKAYLKDNPEKHVWKSNAKFKSVPCEHLKQYLKDKGLEFVEEYNPIPDRMFSVDIAFLDKRIIFEVNGNQHYSDVKLQKLAPYYLERHNMIEAEGWKVIEIHYTKVFDNKYIDNLISELT